jgi:CDP-glycerol glycerophosphotransferase (TagB/SpsB family)
LIPPAGKYDLYKKEFSQAGSVVVTKEIIGQDDFFETFFSSIFKHSIPTKFMKIRQVDWYWNDGKYIKYAFVSILRILGHSKLWRRFLVKFNSIEPIPKEVRNIFNKTNPDLIFAPTMLTRLEVTLMRLGKKNDIPVVGMVKSFDNLTSKSFLRVHPDLLIVPNETSITEAVELYEYPVEKIHVTGICQYDVYADKKAILEPKEEFFKKTGLNPDKKTILYAPAGDWMNPTDHETLSMILDWIDSDILINTQVLLRLHPAYESKTESLAGRANLIVERPGSHYGHLKTYEFDNADVAHLAASLSYADVVINTASTLMVEASIFDTPVISLAFDGLQKLPYWQSVARYYDREHCVPIVTAQGMKLVKNQEKLKESILNYFSNPEQDQEGRKRITEAVAFKIDGKSCERTADVIGEALSSK